MKLCKQWRVLMVVIVMLFVPVSAYADTSASTNYKVEQTFFGSGGELNACSTGPAGYCSKQTVGELGVGNTASASYQAYAGFNTTDDPYIEFVVTPANTDIGYLSPSTPTITTGTFYVRAWQAGNYVVRSTGNAPNNPGGSGHQLAPLTTAAASSPGTEQFGINLVKTPNFCGAGCDLGADPVQVPDNTFSFGQAAPGYNTPGQFKYNKDDTIARSLKSTSVTVYTVSYLFNISLTTPAGQYVFRHDMVATGTY